MRWLWIGALGAAILLLGFHEIWDRDIFFHLATGQAVLDKGALLTENIFTWPESSSPFYHNPAWLFQVGAALVYSGFGLGGVVVAKCLVLLATFALGYRILRQEEAPLQAAVLLLAVAALATAFRFNERPQIISYLFFALTVLMVQRAERRGGQGLAWLVPLMLIWANSHAGFVFGLGYLGLRWVGLVSDPGNGRTPAGRLFAVLVAATGATFINPQPLAPYRFLYQHLHVNKVVPLTEYASPLAAEYTWFYILLGVLVLLGLAKARRFDLPRLLPMVGFLALALSSVRFIPFFALASLPWAGARLGGWKGQRLSGILQRAATVLNVAGPLLLVVVVWTLPPVPAKRQVAVNRQMTPLAAFEFLNRYQPQGRLYNSLNYGAPGMFYLYPRFRLFQTSYIQVEEDIMAEAHRAGDSPATWRQFLDRYGIEVALVDTRMDLPSRENFPQEEWALVFFDDVSAIFLRRGRDNEGLIARHEYRVVAPNFLAMEQVGQAPIDLDRLDEGAAELGRALGLAPESQLLHLMRGYYLSLQGEKDLKALEHFARAVELDPGMAAAYFQMGILNRDLGWNEEAIRALETYLEKSPEDAQGYLVLAELYAAEGQSSRAKKVLELGGRTARKGENVLVALGNFFREEKEFERAIDTYLQALTLVPDHPDILNELGIARGMQGDLKGALATFDRVLALRPNHAGARRNRAYALQLISQERKP